MSIFPLLSVSRFLCIVIVGYLTCLVSLKLKRQHFTISLGKIILRIFLEVYVLEFSRAFKCLVGYCGNHCLLVINIFVLVKSSR
jgi:predicted CDP-diglyceride synthetase/phosphatidate cytidylyltransferase